MTVLALPSLKAEIVAATAATDRLPLINRDPCPDEENVHIRWPLALRIVDVGTDGVDRASTRIYLNGTPAPGTPVILEPLAARAVIRRSLPGRQVARQYVVPSRTIATVQK